MSNNPKTYLSKVVHEDGATIVLFPTELLAALALRPNEILEWHVGDSNDKEILIKRHHIIDNKTV